MMEQLHGCSLMEVLKPKGAKGAEVKVKLEAHTMAALGHGAHLHLIDSLSLW